MQKITVTFKQTDEMGQIKATPSFSFLAMPAVELPGKHHYIHLVRDWDEFSETFQPLGLDDLGEAFEGFFDNDIMVSLDSFENVDPAHVWTVVDNGDGEIYIAEGFHFVNRLGYLLCRAPRIIKHNNEER